MNDQQQTEFEARASKQGRYGSADCPVDYRRGVTRDAEKVWQAALESPEVQSMRLDLEQYVGIASELASENEALRNDAERYRKLVADWFDHVHGREFGLINDMPPEAYESKADVDAAIDHARRVEGEGK